MSPRLMVVLAMLVLIGSSSVSAAPPAAPAAVGTAFTYQGRLLDNGAPANGPYDFQLRLYDALTGGAQVGSTVSQGDVTVTNGLFTVTLDFGASAFSGGPRYLQVETRSGASTGAYTPLTPRQALLPAPYSMYTTNADQLDGLHASNFLATSGGTVNGALDVNGVLLGYYGGGVTHGGDATTDRFLVGSLSPNNANNADKLFVTVWGGGWSNSTLGQSFFSVSSRGGLKITRTQLFGSTSMYALKVYSTTVGYDVVVEVVYQSYPDVAIRSFKMGGSLDGFLEQPVTGGYSITGKPDVTPVIENHIIVNNSGYVGIGTASPAAQLEVSGTMRSKIVQITGGADLAEPFDVSGDRVEPGFVVAIDPDRPGALRISDRAYDKTVAGCISGANGVNPGLVMQHEGTSAAGQYPVALSGRVYCYADAQFGAIEPGDLLTSSGTPGHLQAVAGRDRARGAIVGKAMSGLTDGRGLILVLVTLQ
jgi:hypothetical protein